MRETKSRAEDFRGVDRVRLSELGVAQGFQGRASAPTGSVIAVQPPFRIKVLRDGLKQPDWYHCDFWVAEPVSPSGATHE